MGAGSSELLGVSGSEPLTPRKVALATCAEVPELDEDGPALIAELAARGVSAVPAVWDARDVDWAAFDLVVLRSTWDYAEQLDAFLEWAARLPRVLNELDVIRWNVDKRYLAELERAGVATVPTRVLEAGEAFQPPGGRFVVKPVVSAGGRRSAAYEASDASAARAHVAHLQAQGHRVMIQPYLAGVDDRGETALLYLNGGYSHAVRKAALLADGRPPGEELYLEETIEATKATPAERHVAARALAAVPLPASNLLYARVDLVPGRDGEPLLLELELIEPSLYLSYAPGAVARLADGIATRLSSF